MKQILNSEVSKLCALSDSGVAMGGGGGGLRNRVCCSCASFQIMRVQKDKKIQKPSVLRMCTVRQIPVIVLYKYVNTVC